MASYPQNSGQQGYPPQQEYSKDANQGAQYNQNAPTSTVIIRQGQNSQPNDYLAFAIIVTICCCLPFGIVAIVKSMDVRNRFISGDVAGSEEASQSAKSWSIAGLVTGIVLYVIGIIGLIIYLVSIIVSLTTTIRP